MTCLDDMFVFQRILNKHIDHVRQGLKLLFNFSGRLTLRKHEVFKNSVDNSGPVIFPRWFDILDTSSWFPTLTRVLKRHYGTMVISKFC